MQEAWCAVPIWVQRHENKENQLCKLQSKGWQDWYPRIVNVSFWTKRLEKNQSSRSVRREEFPFIQGRGSLYILPWCSSVWLRDALIRKASLLHSGYQFKCLLHLETSLHTQNNVWPNIWELYGLVKLIHKINYHKCILCNLGIHMHLFEPHFISK